MRHVSPFEYCQNNCEPKRCRNRTYVHFFQMLRIDYVLECVLRLDLLVSNSPFIKDKWKNHESLHEESPADSQKFCGLNVHNP